MKRKILAGLLTLCMAAGMAVPAAAATTPAEQEQGADGPQYTHVDHVLNEDTHTTNMDILVMPGESFTAQHGHSQGQLRVYHGGLSVLEVCNYGSIHECRPVFGIC